MAATDTVIGIVGVVVLVGVMVGVFVYEYNNAPEIDEGPTGEEGNGFVAGSNETEQFSGAIGASAPPVTDSTYLVTFTPNRTVASINATMTYSAPGAPTALDNALVFQLLDSEGTVLATGDRDASSTTVTISLVFEEALDAGEYTLQVSHERPGPGTNISGEYTLIYG